MKKILYLLVIISIPALLSAQPFFYGKLTTSQEAEKPVNASNAGGTIAAKLTPDGLWYSLTVDGLSGPITAAHFHKGVIGLPGPAIKDIKADFSGNTATGVWLLEGAQSITDSTIIDLIMGRIFVNVHTAQNPNGEIRAQLLLASGTGFKSILTPFQIPSSIESDGVGTGVYTLTEKGLKFEITFNSLTGPVTNAHFHRGVPGVEGPAVFPLMPYLKASNTFEGFWASEDFAGTMNAQFVKDLLMGNIYINIHTSQYPAGEIRGQLLIDGGTTFSSRLDSSGFNTPNPIMSSGRGLNQYTLTDAGIVYNSIASGLTGNITGSGLYQSEGHMNVFNNYSDFNNSYAAGVWSSSNNMPLDYNLIGDFFAGNLQSDLQTSQYQQGEISGPIMLNEGSNYSVYLTPALASGDTLSNARGTGILTSTPLTYDYYTIFNDQQNEIVNANLYLAGTTLPGDSLFDITSGINNNIGEGSFPKTGNPIFDEQILRQIIAGNLYMGIKREGSNNLSLLGQFNVIGGTGFKAVLTPNQEFVKPQGAVNARGVAAVTLINEGLAYHLTFSGLSGAVTAAHFHSGDIGEDGPAIKDLMFDLQDSSIMGFWSVAGAESFSSEILNLLLTGKLYVNIHTANNPQGEIRGQVLLNGGIAFISEIRGSESIPQNNSTARGTAIYRFTPAGLLYNMTVQGFANGISGASFNNAAIGQTGSVSRDFFNDFDESNTIAGVWGPDNAQIFTPAFMSELFKGNLYVGFSGQGGTEGIRGQIVTEPFEPTSVDEVQPDYFSLSLYPNPAQLNSKASFTLESAAKVSVYVVNAAGAEVYKPTDNINFQQGYNEISLNMKSLSQGAYYLIINANGKTAALPFAIVR